MNSEMKPWAKRPFELIFHAEVHYQSGTDYDRRLALISFDNSIEVSISTYLTLNPIQRGNRQYKREDVNKWLIKYHSKLDFYFDELTIRGLPVYKGKDEIVWYHDQRNELYHGSNSGIPAQDVLDDIRKVAIWIFSILFDIVDVESKLATAIAHAEVVISTIPEEYPVPSTPSIVNQEQLSVITVATILGSWDENKEGDQEIIKRLIDGF
jgi:hypothetical protein